MEAQPLHQFTPPAPDLPKRDWLLETGDMAELIRDLDWSQTPLGDRATWPKTLRVATNLILASKFPMAILWGPELTYIYNDGYQIIAGPKHPSALGKSTREIWPEVWEFNKPIFAQVLNLGKSMSFEDQLFHINRKSSLEEAYFTLSYSPIYLENGGKPGKIGGALIVLQETTRYVISERSLRESQKLLKSIIDSTPSDIFALNPEHRFTLANAALAKTYQIPNEKILGMTEHDLFSKDVADRVFADNETILKTGKGMTLEQELESPDHSLIRTVITSKFPIKDAEDRIVGVGGVTTDITERKKLEQELLNAKIKAEEAAQIKAQFLDIAAHELRNPITVISLLIQVFQDHLKKGQTLGEPHLNRLREPVERLRNLIVDLLDVSRLERGLVKLEPRLSDLIPTIQKCIEDFKLQAPGREFSLQAPPQPVYLKFDSPRIMQVLSNLLDNAVKYTPNDGPIQVAVETGANRVRVSIKDEGPGIPEEQLQSLFKAFSRGDSDATLRASGLGLGLSVCQGIIDLHGGTIGVQSKVGKGSEFYFELPLCL